MTDFFDPEEPWDLNPRGEFEANHLEACREVAEAHGLEESTVVAFVIVGRRGGLSEQEALDLLPPPPEAA